MLGILVVIIGTLVKYIINKTCPDNLPEICSRNKNYIMELRLFATGFLTHILYELSGINRSMCIAKLFRN